MKMPIKRLPRLPGRSVLNDAHSISDTINAVKEQQEKTRSQINSWLKANDKFNDKPYIDAWIKQRNKHKDMLLNLVIEHMSVADAVIEVNEILRYGLSMEEVSIDTSETNNIIGKMFRIRVTEMLVQKAALGKAYKQDIVKRAIAREFPLRDGAPIKSERQPMQVSVPRTPLNVTVPSAGMPNKER